MNSQIIEYQKNQWQKKYIKRVDEELKNIELAEDPENYKAMLASLETAWSAGFDSAVTIIRCIQDEKEIKRDEYVKSILNRGKDVN